MKKNMKIKGSILSSFYHYYVSDTVLLKRLHIIFHTKSQHEFDIEIYVTVYKSLLCYLSV